jgi:hypothetical protein
MTATRRATLLVTAVDELFGTHTVVRPTPGAFLCLDHREVGR